MPRLPSSFALLALAAAACSNLTSNPSSSAAGSVPPAAVVVSSEALTGAPRLVTAQLAAPEYLRAAAPEQAARWHLNRLAPLYGVGPSAIDRAAVRYVRDLGRGSIGAALRQTLDGVEIYGGDVKVLMRRNRDLVAVAGTLRPERTAAAGANAAGSAARFTSALDGPAAVAHALAHHYALERSAFETRIAGAASGGFDRIALENAPTAMGGALHLVAPARAARRWFARRGGVLVPAYVVEFIGARTGASALDAFRYVLAADDGRVLLKENLTWHEAYQYRVWAHTDGDLVALDGPQEDWTPYPVDHPAGQTDPAFIPPTLVTVEGLNHPAGATGGAPDPWLPPGATETRGNNVDAYSDFNQPAGFSDGDLRASATSPGVFDRTYNTALAADANPDQRMAAVTQAFYTANWVHDFLYDSGFDEAAGNAQADNYGRGGYEGDPLLLEAQQTTGMDNAQMIASMDGESPHLQMFLWRGADRSAVILSPADVTARVGAAQFGPRRFDVTGPLALADDGQGTTSDACEPLVNAVSGHVVLVDRGTCPFSQKVQNVQDAGGLAVIIADNEAQADPPFLAGNSSTISIGSVSVTMADGAQIKAALAGADAQTAHVRRARDVNRDGAIDRSVVTHECGHLLHLRQAFCTINQCAAASEGFGDTLALLSMVRPGDDFHGTYPMGAYSGKAMGDSAYFGIRRFPYSVDFTKNALTLKHIVSGEALPSETPRSPMSGGDNAEAHAAGEVWASALFEVYVALLDDAQQSGRRDFYATRRAMTDYLVAGIQMLPPDANYLETRDAFLAAVAAAGDATDLDLAARAFARRGMGSCAQPPTDSLDPSNAGVVESYEVKSHLVLSKPELTDSLQSCDSDGVLDGLERGELTFEVRNASPIAAKDVVVQVAVQQTEGITFPKGASQAVGELAPFAATTLRFEVDAAQMSGIKLAPFTVTATAAETACDNSSQTVVFAINKDELPNGTTKDDVEASTTEWVTSGEVADLAWTRPADDAGKRHWHAEELGFLSDTQLVSPSVDVSSAKEFHLKFSHRFNFETDTAAGTYFDASAVEISIDGGQWIDVSEWADPGYGGVVTTDSNNALGGQNAFVGTNPAWPAYDAVDVNFGTELAGKSVQVRFRMSTDQAAGGLGWDIDDIAFDGITNYPFVKVIGDRGRCNPAPEVTPPATANVAHQSGCGCAAGAMGGGSPELALFGAMAAAGMSRRRRRRP